MHPCFLHWGAQDGSEDRFVCWKQMSCVLLDFAALYSHRVQSCFASVPTRPPLNTTDHPHRDTFGSLLAFCSFPLLCCSIHFWSHPVFLISETFSSSFRYVPLLLSSPMQPQAFAQNCSLFWVWRGEPVLIDSLDVPPFSRHWKPALPAFVLSFFFLILDRNDMLS